MRRRPSERPEYGILHPPSAFGSQLNRRARRSKVLAAREVSFSSAPMGSASKNDPTAKKAGRQRGGPGDTGRWSRAGGAQLLLFAQDAIDPASVSRDHGVGDRDVERSPKTVRARFDPESRKAAMRLRRRFRVSEACARPLRLRQMAALQMPHHAAANTTIGGNMIYEMRSYRAMPAACPICSSASIDHAEAVREAWHQAGRFLDDEVGESNHN